MMKTVEAKFYHFYLLLFSSTQINADIVNCNHINELGVNGWTMFTNLIQQESLVVFIYTVDVSFLQVLSFLPKMVLESCVIQLQMPTMKHHNK